ncbi:tail fiber protein [Pseudanabaena phage Pam3]|uniref:Tail fiber protein n=2 Tax=Viruses TaxID=10239 RepID=A0ACD6BAN7_9CAUD|nr:tail fiber protein [Pseudanabaena phage Pam3]7YFW_a Chain a, Pam3 fiber proreins [uncultured cyanophage]7YFW_b Chain b, Pam3 fiber proreins [uncultured cyanophage]7YFW_c Chain c, Pam3 fiber proreins [uncultured cyanophage]
MASINLPFSLSGSKRIPTSEELADGYQCGPLDVELDNWLMWWLTGQVDGVIEGAGLTTDDTDLARLYKAIQSMTSGNLRTVVLTAASGNLPIPSDVSVLNWVRAVGGGGAGGNSNTGNSKASGGGGGAGFDRFNVAVTPGSNVPYTVGAAGAVNGLGAGYNGGAGGSTAILGTTAGGGAGGLGVNNNATAVQVNGGTTSGTTPEISYPGGLGTEGIVGTGGGSVLSQPTQRAFTNAGNNNPANSWGGGGPGGSDFGGAWQPGGVGKQGIIIVQYFSRFAP